MTPQSPVRFLHACRVGETVCIAGIHDLQTQAQAMRLGIATGETVTLLARVPGGPLVVRRGQTDIALGQSLCQSIEVTPADGAS